MIKTNDMREIKFRAWNKHTEIMYSLFIVGAPCTSEGPTLNIMQYTGLKDKNGVEIYEGDVLENKSTIEYYNGAWWIKHLTEGYDVHLDFAIFNNLGVVVVGNIYENPEMLQNNQTKSIK